MIRRWLAATVTAGTLLASAPQTAAQTTATPTGQDALQRLASCVASADHLLAVVVVDESGSLRQTDPTDARVHGVVAAVDALHELQRSADARLDVQVSLATFATGYEPLVDWAPLDEQHAALLRDTARGELPGRDSGRDTDYRQALNGARGQLEEREQQLGTSRTCKTVLWFTDGALDVRGETEQAARDICDLHGLADAVRGDQITVVALALLVPAGPVTPAQREQLQAVAEGTAGGQRCGSLPLAAGASPGVFLSADEVSVLNRLFAGVVARAAGASDGESLRCPGSACHAGLIPLTVDRGVAGLRALVDTPTAARLALHTPEGTVIPLDPTHGPVPVPGGTAELSAAGGLSTVTARFDGPVGAQVGGWHLTVEDVQGMPVPAAVDLFWFWGASWQLPADVKVVVGETTQLAPRLLDQDGEPVDPTVYADLQVTAELDGNPVPVSTAGGTSLRVTVPEGDFRTWTSLRLMATATTTPSRLRLGPAELDVPLRVELPPGYPSVEPGVLDLGTLRGDAPLAATLPVIGSDRGPTAACLMATDVSGPGDAGLELTAPSGCVQVEQGGLADLPLVATVRRAADGQASGELTLRLTAADGSVRDVVVPVRLGLTRPVDEPTRWALVAALTVLALALPLLLRWITNRWLGRFRVDHRLSVAVVPVTVSAAGGLTRRDDPTGVLLTGADFRYLPYEDGRRSRLRLPGDVDVAARRPWGGFAAPRAVASVLPQRRIAGNRPPYAGLTPQAAPASFALGECWWLVADGDARDGDAALPAILVVPRVEREEDSLDERVRQLRAFADWDRLVAALTPAPVETDVAAGAPSDPPPTEYGVPPAPLDDPPPLPPYDEPPPSPEDGGTTPGTAERSPRPRRRMPRLRIPPPRRGQSVAPVLAPPAPGTDDAPPPLSDF